MRPSKPPLRLSLLVVLAALPAPVRAGCRDMHTRAAMPCPQGVDNVEYMDGKWYDGNMNEVTINAPAARVNALAAPVETPTTPPLPSGQTPQPGEQWHPPHDDGGALEPQELGLTEEQMRAINKEFPGSVEQMHGKYHRLMDGLADMVNNPDPDPSKRVTAAQAEQYSQAIDAGIKKISADAYSYVKWSWLPWRTREGSIQDLKKDIDDITNNLNMRIQYRDAQGQTKTDSVHMALMAPDGGMKKIMDRIYEAANGGGPGGGSSSGGLPGGHERETANANPHSADAQSMAAEELLQGNNPAAAMGYINKALAIDPQNQRALSDLAVADYQLRDYAAAAKDAHAALDLKANDPAAQAVLQFTEGRAGVGGAKLGNVADLFSARTGAASPAGDSAVAGKYGRGGRLAAGGPDSDGQTRGALEALRLRDAQAALSAANRALAANPNDVRALNARAMALLKLRRYQDALNDADAALKKAPGNRALMNVRAQALNKLKRFADAEAQARAALALNPNDAAAWRNLAEALAGKGDNAGALAALKRAAELDPQFKPLLETAVQLPSDADLNLLFADDAGAGAAAPKPSVSSRGRAFGLVVGGALGLGLILFSLLWPLVAPRLKTAWTSITKRRIVGAAPVQAVAPDLIKGQFRIGRQIGYGGMGTVYEGLDVSLRRPVAIKKMREEIRSDPRERARFLQEAKVVAALHHPNIVDIYAIAEEGQDVFLVFQFVNGRTLHELIASRGRLRLAEALPILRGAAAGLEYAHGRGIIHRDLKPSNVMLDAENEVKVMDFGIARVAKDALTRASQVMTNTIVGTPPYMAPEQEQGLVRKESDVYALALCLYEMLTGRMAFAGTGAGMLMSKLNKAYAPVTTLAPELPPEIDAVFTAALDPEPGKRIASAQDLLARVEAVAAGKRA